MSKELKNLQEAVPTSPIPKTAGSTWSRGAVAMLLMASCKNGFSSYEVHRALGVTQKTAPFMDHRIRLAQRACSSDKLSGEVGVDETFIGRQARNMHLEKRQRDKSLELAEKTRPPWLVSWSAVVRFIPNRRKKALQAEMRKHFEAGSALDSDALLSYERLAGGYAHWVIDHAIAYVDGKVQRCGKRGVSSRGGRP